jgi:hypothetical protein
MDENEYEASSRRKFRKTKSHYVLGVGGKYHPPDYKLGVDGEYHP